MKKRLLSIGIISCMLFSLAGCTSNGNETSSTSKIKVGVTIAALKDFTESIGGDKVDVFSIIPDGSEAHDFEPKPKDLKDLQASKLFIYNGAGMEEWIDSVDGTLKDSGVETVEASKGINLINLSDEKVEDTHVDGEDSNEHKESGTTDPHTWLSLDSAIQESENIRDALIKIDPNNKSYYEDNYNKVKEEYISLKNEYIEKFKEVKEKDFIAGHAAFAYLCRDFGLTQKSIENVFGEGELTPKKLEALINYCKENNIKTVFSESAASQKESETLAKEVSAKIEKLYTLEAKEDSKSYLDAMKYNLKVIYDSLNSK